MFHPGRSGSTVLGDILSQNSQIRWRGEIIAYILERDKSDPRLIKYSQNKELLYHTIKSEMCGTPKKFFGFATKFYHLKFFNENLNQYLDNLSRIGYKNIIVLERKNHLKSIISSLLAENTKIWHSRNKITNNPLIKIDVNNIPVDGEVKPLMALLEDYNASFKEIHRISGDFNTLHITYEEDILNNLKFASSLVPKKNPLKLTIRELILLV